MQSEFQAEAIATEAINKWLQDARRCVDLIKAAKMPMHPALIRVLGSDLGAREEPPQSSRSAVSPEIQVPTRKPVKRRDPKTFRIPTEPNPPSRPSGVGADWVYLPTKEASPRNLTIAVLYTAKEGISAAEINRIVNIARASRNGSAAAYNSLHRLRLDGDIVGENDSYRLTNSALRGIIQDGWLWVPQSMLTDQDRASIRRRAITRILRLNGPLNSADVTKILDKCTWMGVPITKDVGKADLAAMELEHRVRRLEDKTWEALGRD